MALTQSKLKQIIKEEISQALDEGILSQIMSAYKKGQRLTALMEKILSDKKMQEILSRYDEDDEEIMEYLRQGVLIGAALKMHEKKPLTNEEFKYIKNFR